MGLLPTQVSLIHLLLAAAALLCHSDSRAFLERATTTKPHSAWPPEKAAKTTTLPNVAIPTAPRKAYARAATTTTKAPERAPANLPPLPVPGAPGAQGMPVKGAPAGQPAGAAAPAHMAPVPGVPTFGTLFGPGPAEKNATNGTACDTNCSQPCPPLPVINNSAVVQTLTNIAQITAEAAQAALNNIQKAGIEPSQSAKDANKLSEQARLIWDSVEGTFHSTKNAVDRNSRAIKVARNTLERAAVVYNSAVHQAKAVAPHIPAMQQPPPLQGRFNT